MKFVLDKESAFSSAVIFNMAAVTRFGVNNILASINGRVSRKFCPNCIAALSGGNVLFLSPIKARYVVK